MYEAPENLRALSPRDLETLAKILRKIAPDDHSALALVPRFLSDHEYGVVAAAADRLIPPLDDASRRRRARRRRLRRQPARARSPFDPPLIFAGGPFSGRYGGDASFARVHAAVADTRRSRGARASRVRAASPNASSTARTRGWQDDLPRPASPRSAPTSATVDGDEQDRRLAAQPELRDVLYEHACEGAYGPPEYGGNRDLAGWRVIGWEGDVQPRGYTDDEVSGRA